MADYTYMQLTVLECPQQNVNDAVALLADYDFCEEGDVLTLGEQMTLESAPLGTLWQELGPELAALCSFTGWEDPKYEYYGTRVTSLLSDPEGSRITISDCFQDGHPVVSVAAIRRHLQLGTVEKLLQVARETAIEALEEACRAAPAVLKPHHYVIIERERPAHLAVRYPDRTAAEWALSSSFFINSLCEEDCLDAFVSLRVDKELREGAHGLEEIVPPDDDTSTDGSAMPASLQGWEARGVDG